ncbi:unnamed protein product [Caenorhabditis sp. 36 PRJEB53466]|nr:unnamed protein product [Caenorhabditis sp. 36 PRJEB53466]
MRALLAVVALIGFVVGQDQNFHLSICSNPPKTPPKALSDKIALPESYKVSGSVTDWMKSSTSLLVESATKEYRVLQKQTRDEMPQRWIERLTGAKQTTSVNLNTGECIADAPDPNVFNISRFDSIIGSDMSSLYSIIQGLIAFNKNHTGFLVEDYVEVVGGVNSMKWVSCINGTTTNDTKVVLEVRYAGEATIRPALSEFSNPLLLSIRLAELPDFNSTVALNHVSIELDRYELPTGDEAAISHGVYCQNLNSTDLPLKPLDEYAAVLNYYDYSSNRSEVVEILYSKSRQMFIVTGDSLDYGLQLLRPDKRYEKGTDYVLHDFKYGYEFTMSREACMGFSALDNSTRDVARLNDTTLSMQPMQSILVDPSLRWVEYQKDVDVNGKSFKTYRAFSTKTNDEIVELQLTDDGELHSMAKFQPGSRRLTLSLSVSKMSVESSRLNRRAAQFSDCYDDGKFANNTWIVQIRDKNTTDLRKVGLNRLNEAVADSISKNVHPIIPYRVVVYWVENKDNGLSIILRIAEKTVKPPANVGYNYTTELSTADLYKLLNYTILLDKMPIVVEKVDGVKEEWMVDGSTMKMYPPDNDSGFVGYTGGAMFVLAIFCLLIGISIGAVGVFVATRRQRISTLAYQVFE